VFPRQQPAFLTLTGTVTKLCNAWAMFQLLCANAQILCGPFHSLMSPMTEKSSETAQNLPLYEKYFHGMKNA
jgi:hypothetical protein